MTGGRRSFLPSGRRQRTMMTGMQRFVGMSRRRKTGFCALPATLSFATGSMRTLRGTAKMHRTLARKSASPQGACCSFASCALRPIMRRGILPGRTWSGQPISSPGRSSTRTRTSPCSNADNPVRQSPWIPRRISVSAQFPISSARGQFRD